jgi:hypothetical protein
MQTPYVRLMDSDQQVAGTVSSEQMRSLMAVKKRIEDEE